MQNFDIPLLTSKQKKAFAEEFTVALYKQLNANGLLTDLQLQKLLYGRWDYGQKA